MTSPLQVVASRLASGMGLVYLAYKLYPTRLDRERVLSLPAPRKYLTLFMNRVRSITVGALLGAATPNLVYLAISLMAHLLMQYQGQRCMYWYSTLVRYFMTKPRLKPEVVRQAFLELPIEAAPEPKDHTHPIAAADRSTAGNFMERLGPLLGLKTYFHQRSRFDEKRGRPGSRAYFWVKDLQTKPALFRITEDSLVAMVDVDEYIDMPTFLADYVQPTLLYTFQPSAVARVTPNYSYTFNENNEVEYVVSGGGRYTHQVWNYSQDHLLVSKTFLGIPYKYATYLVDRRATSQDHELVMLTPMGSWSWYGAYIMAVGALQGRPLRRLLVTTPTTLVQSILHTAPPVFLRLETHLQGGAGSSTAEAMVSTGKPLSHICATIPKKIDDTIATLAQVSQYPLTVPQVQSFVDSDREKAAILTQYHRLKASHKPDILCPVEHAVRSYQYHPNPYIPEDKPMIKAFMRPLLNGAFTPTVSASNERECIDARIDRVKAPLIKMTPFLTSVVQEFARLLVPDNLYQTLYPTDMDEVQRRQDAPRQRRNFHTTAGLLSKGIFSMFMKREAYPKVAAPRPISIMDPVDKRDYSTFMYSLEVILKDQPWYAFSKKPKDIASRVADVLKHALFALNTDFSKFDGHVSNVVRELERIILLRAFRPEFHEQVIKLHKAQFFAKAYGTFGSKYNTGYARASGSPETSLFNTVTNAFVAYLAARKSGLDMAQAWASLGIYGGDDGLTANIEPIIYIKAAQDIGQELTADKILRGNFGIKFLSRVYSPHVWEGDVNSCCDLPRQLAKFHTTVGFNTNVTPTDKLLEKTRSFLLTDANTPIIGQFVRRVVDIHGDVPARNEQLKRMHRWFDKYQSDDQYINEPADWMNAYAAQAFPEFDQARYATALSEAKSLNDLMNLPTYIDAPEAKSSIPVVVDGEMLPREGNVRQLTTQVLKQPTSNEEVKGPPVGGQLDTKTPPTPTDRPKRKGRVSAAQYLEIKRQKQALGIWVPEVPRKKESFKEMETRKRLNLTWEERPKRNDHKKAVTEMTGLVTDSTNKTHVGLVSPIPASQAPPRAAVAPELKPMRPKGRKPKPPKVFKDAVTQEVWRKK